MRVVAVDPGVVTGIVAMDIWEKAGETRYDIREHQQIDSGVQGEFMAAYQAAAFISQWVEEGILYRPEVVFEDFVLRRQEMDRTLLAPVRMGGLVLGLMASCPHWYVVGDRGLGGGVYGVKAFEVDLTRVPFSVQQPSQAKSIVTDARLKDWGLWIKGQKHVRDAIRHAVVRYRAVR